MIMLSTESFTWQTPGMTTFSRIKCYYFNIEVLLLEGKSDMVTS